MESKSLQFRLIGGRLCLNFLNTADWSSDSTVIEEHLNDTSDIIAWRDAVGLQSILIPDHAAFREALIQLRGNIRAIVMSLINGNQPAPRLLAEFNQNLRTNGTISLTAGLKGSLLYGPETALTKAIEFSALALLSDVTEIGRVKICQGDDCGWLFLDESKNRRRQWCTMDTCGNRAKAKRFYYRHSKA